MILVVFSSDLYGYPKYCVTDNDTNFAKSAIKADGLIFNVNHHEYTRECIDFVEYIFIQLDRGTCEYEIKCFDYLDFNVTNIVNIGWQE